MPAWGGVDNRIGNNPFIVAIPRDDGRHIMLDMAVSQYSYGAVEKAARDGKMLPVPGGYDRDGNLTNDPNLLWESRRMLPAGFWKGSCMSIVFDLLAAGLSRGNTTQDIGSLPAEIECSQIFVAISPKKCGDDGYFNFITDKTIENIKASVPETEGGAIYYPNEMSYDTREDNLKNGIPADEGFWEAVKSF
jgi:3-dehydro-L-gulonate 2-dehydrogenase